MAKKAKKKTASTTPATPRKKVVRSTRRTRGQEPIISDARDISKTARSLFRRIQQYDANRKTKLLPVSRLDAFDASIRTATTAVGGSRTRKTVTKAATSAEVKARAEVFAIVDEVRGVVKLAVQDDPEMCEAFLVGASVRPSSTSGLIKAAADVQQAFQNEAYKKRCLALGIDKSTITKLIAKRRALTAADTTQGAVTSSTKAATTVAKTALKQIEKETAYIRGVAKLAFKGDATTLAKFAPRTPLAISRKAPAPAPKPGP